MSNHGEIQQWVLCVSCSWLCYKKKSYDKRVHKIHWQSQNTSHWNTEIPTCYPQNPISQPKSWYIVCAVNTTNRLLLVNKWSVKHYSLMLPTSECVWHLSVVRFETGSSQQKRYILWTPQRTTYRHYSINHRGVKFNACQRICYTGMKCVLMLEDTTFRSCCNVMLSKLIVLVTLLKGGEKLQLDWALVVNFLIKEKPNTVGISLYEQRLIRMQMMRVRISHMHDFYYVKVGVYSARNGL
jgi:hypothetical protein